MEFNEFTNETINIEVAKRVLTILLDAFESVSKLLNPENTTDKEMQSLLAEQQAKIFELKRIKKSHNGKRNYRKRGKSLTVNYQLPPKAAKAMQAAIEYAGSAYKLIKLCKVNSARIYEITGGQVTFVQEKLAIRIHAATKGAVKCWDLCDHLIYMKDKTLDELKNEKFFKNKLD